MKGTSPGTEDDTRKKEPERRERRDSEMSQIQFLALRRRNKKKEYNGGTRVQCYKRYANNMFILILTGAGFCVPCSASIPICKFWKPYFPWGTTPVHTVPAFRGLTTIRLQVGLVTPAWPITELNALHYSDWFKGVQMTKDRPVIQFWDS